MPLWILARILLESAKVTKNISIYFSKVWIKLFRCDCFTCLSIKQTLILNMLKEHPACSLSLPFLQSCTFHGFFLCFICFFPFFSLGNEKSTNSSYFILDINREFLSWSLIMPKKGWLFLEDSATYLKCDIPLFVSFSLWNREQPMEMVPHLAVQCTTCSWAV